MTHASQQHGRDHSERVLRYALQALSTEEMSAMEMHISGCAHCRREMQALRRIADAFVAWPIDLLRPPVSLWGRLAQRIGSETGAEPARQALPSWVEPEWKDVAPGISCKLLATDSDMNRVSMLVRLAPGTDYPPHTHAGVEELHLLDGELWIDDRKFYPGDYNRAEPGTADKRVWSETGCTCVLITSPGDLIK